MSTISRRDFMKTAGVMTLAVAASAALAGCSTEEPASSTVVTANSITVSDCTVSIKSAKLYDYQTGTVNDDNTVTVTTTRYLLVLIEAKQKDLASYVDFELPENTFRVVTTNASKSDDYTAVDYSVYGTRKDLKTVPLTEGKVNAFLESDDFQITAPDMAMQAALLYKVDEDTTKVAENDYEKGSSSAALKTPTFQLSVRNTTLGVVTLDAEIPATGTVITKADKIFQ